MTGLVPAIHVLLILIASSAWMPATGAGMTPKRIEGRMHLTWASCLAHQPELQRLDLQRQVA